MTPAVQSSDLLAAIVAATRRIIAVRAAGVPMADLERRAAGIEPRPGAFAAAVAQSGRCNVIAECKRRSPSRGTLRLEYDPAAIATSYEHAGAAAISVLTEGAFFDGTLDHLAAVRQATSLPILRKDFIVDRYQVYEARAAGADAILLIVAALSRLSLAELHAAAVDAGLDVLVEVHDLAEITAAVDAGASIIGVNNRNLRTLAIDVEVSARAIELIPDAVVAIAESGLKTGEDVRRLRQAGYDAFLIGERFMTTPDPGGALMLLLESVGG